MNTATRAGLGIGLLLALLACSVDRFPLPSVSNVAETGFSPGDTSFLMLNRSIELDAGADPADLFINDDGHVYVAERGLGRISVWDQALNRLSEPGLEEFQLDSIRGVCVGPEQLLFAVAGDSALWSVNLQANREDLVWGFSRLIGTSPEGNLDTLDAEQVAQLIEDRELNDWTIVAIDSLDLESDGFRSRLEPRIFWSGSRSTRLDAVAKGRIGKREVYVMNNNRNGNRINRIQFKPSAVVFTANPDVPVVYLYDSIQQPLVVISQGAGVGTVEAGLSLDADEQGYLYFTQAAPTVGYWKAQRLEFTVDNDGSDAWSFDFLLQGRDLMTPDRFDRATDIAYTNSNLYVLDRRDADTASDSTALAHHVQVFKRNGNFLLPLGARRVQRDTTFMVDGIAVDSTLKSWAYDQLGDPRSVAVYGNRSERAGTDDEIIFVADSNRVKLFLISVSEDDLPTQ